MSAEAISHQIIKSVCPTNVRETALKHGAHAEYTFAALSTEEKHGSDRPLWSYTGAL